MYPQKRILISIRNEIPLISIVPAVLLGQVLYWFLRDNGPYTLRLLAFIGCWLPIAFVSRTAWVVFRRCFSPGGIAGVAAGAITAAIFTATPFAPLNARTYQLVVGSDVRYPMPGSVRFESAVFDSAGRTFLGFARCTAKHLPWLHTAELLEGDRVLVRATWRALERPGILGNDAAARRRGFGADCRVRYAAAPIRAERSIGAFRAAIVRRVRLLLGDTERTGLLLALTLGAHDLVSDQLERRFREGGLSHLLVVSGFQVGLVASSAFLIFRRVQLLLPIQSRGFHICWLLSFVVAFGFAFLVGVQNSVLRAAVAFVYLGLAQLWERGGGIWRGMVAAFLIVSLLCPGAYLEAGVQLTFAALIGIATARSERAGAGWGALAMSWSVMLCTGWCALLWFGQIAPGALLLNLTVAPILGTVVCILGLAGLLLIGIAPSIAWWVLSAALLVMDFGVLVIDACASSIGRAYECTEPWEWAGAIILTTVLLVRHLGRYVRQQCVEFGVVAMVRDSEAALWDTAHRRKMRTARPRVFG